MTSVSKGAGFSMPVWDVRLTNRSDDPLVSGDVTWVDAKVVDADGRMTQVMTGNGAGVRDHGICAVALESIAIGEKGRFRLRGSVDAKVEVQTDRNLEVGSYLTGPPAGSYDGATALEAQPKEASVGSKVFGYSAGEATYAAAVTYVKVRITFDGVNGFNGT